MALGNNLVKQDKSLESKENEELKETETANQSEALSSESEGEAKDSKYEQYCVFKTGNEEYALPIHLIKEVVKYAPPAPLPQMPPYILGATNIRGNVFGILDIQLFFNIKSEQDHKYLLVLDHEVYKMSIGIPEVPDSLLIEDSEIENLNSSTLKTKVGQKYMKGVIKRDNRMIILFDIEGIISSEKFTVSA